MNDKACIQDTITAYSQNASLGNWEQVLALFQPDAIWEIPHLGVRFAGTEAIAGALSGFKEHMDYVLQLNAPALIAISGDRAKATSAIREHGKAKGANEGFEYLGIYEDAFVCTSDGWKFTHRVFRGIGSHFTPLRLEQT